MKVGTVEGLRDINALLNWNYFLISGLFGVKQCVVDRHFKQGDFNYSDKSSHSGRKSVTCLSPYLSCQALSNPFIDTSVEGCAINMSKVSGVIVTA